MFAIRLVQGTLRDEAGFAVLFKGKRAYDHWEYSYQVHQERTLAQRYSILPSLVKEGSQQWDERCRRVSEQSVAVLQLRSLENSV